MQSTVKPHVDKNFHIISKVNEPDIIFRDVRAEPFKIYGLYNPLLEPQFKRLPDDVGCSVNKGVKELYKNTAGGRVRFCTDSAYVAIRAVMPNVCLMSHMPLLSSAGFDLYEDSPDGMHSKYRGSFKPSIDMKDGYESEIKFSDRRMRYFTVNFPSYSDVSTLEIGLQETAALGEGAKYRGKFPIIYYGSSITQGACASRPGNSYQNLVSARLGLDYINLGFSGSCKGEESIARYMATLPMCAFVCDYDHNSPSSEHLRETHKEIYRIIRSANPNIPYVLMSRPDFHRDARDSIHRRDAVIDAYRHAKSLGDQNVYYIDGEGIFRGEYEDACTVDGTHPNDLGFALMANTLCCTLERIMTVQNILE